MSGLDGARIVVTGGAGFIGSHTVDALLGTHPAHVLVLDSLVNGSEENLSQWEGDSRLSLVVGDIRDRGLVDSVMAGADVVFHLACLGVRHSLHSPVANHEVNATGSLMVALAARDAGVSRLVHVSSSEVFGTARTVPMDENHPTWPETVYGAGKLAGEAYSRAMFRTFGTPVVVVRPFNTYGPRSHAEGDSGEIIPRTIVRMANGERPVLYGDGNQTRDFMHVSDTAAGLLALAECDEAIGRTVTIGTGVETTMREVCRLIADALGRPDLTPRMLPGRPGDVLRLCADGTTMARLTGFTPTVTLADGIADLVDWFAGRATEDMLIEDLNWERDEVAP
ncbi:NAD-dependent epimerase/dehydratase family protein [Flaviflexus salsibiostraticola]|uniref:NAD-dependent epimerase/dehydratase family protein n=1 Tax=Flaviflexus salsibiostraticola TaxID=1282737 RepID=A0A3Q8WS56_9ACTO|nr:GDP-mannose 4,6-dehydratase [Flaviflexus salsibiostraticola]AZN29014.1 NAD-dependent epimerase/dehydratase family protein [Flaviflexus salsibiostraticola]